MVFYCERAAGFCIERLEHVRDAGQNFGYGVGRCMNRMLAQWEE